MIRDPFVLQVHFSAPKEALSSHFTQCGPIVRLISPVNTVAGQQPGYLFLNHVFLFSILFFVVT